MLTTAKHQQKHAIVIPYPLQGHVNPSVHLAINLASRGFTITFINTQHIDHKASTAAGGSSHDIFARTRDTGDTGLDIRYTTVSDGLPRDFDRSLNHDQFMASLLHVFSAHVEEVVAKIVKDEGKVDCLIADTFFVWPSKIAKKYGMLYVSLWTEPALVFNLYYHVHLLRINGHFECPDARKDTIDYIPGAGAIQPKDLMSYLQEEDTTSISHQIIFAAFQDVRGADFVLCNTVQELEPTTISALQSNSKLPFYAIGPIFPDRFTESTVSTSLWSESDCTQWLNTKPHGSVLYVSFGSYSHIKKNDLIEVANGLLLSKVSFVWVLRPDIVSSDDLDPLPRKTKEQIGEQGLIIPWCHQNAVLAHPAVGGFLTHCGWNSILESCWCGVPLLCLPLYTDQFTNKKLVVDDWKIGISLLDQKSIRRRDVAEKINHLMNEETGEEFRNAVGDVKHALENASMPEGSSVTNMDKFIKDLESKFEKRLRTDS